MDREEFETYLNASSRVAAISRSQALAYQHSENRITAYKPSSYGSLNECPVPILKYKNRTLMCCGIHKSTGIPHTENLK